MRCAEGLITWNGVNKEGGYFPLFTMKFESGGILNLTFFFYKSKYILKIWPFLTKNL